MTVEAGKRLGASYGVPQEQLSSRSRPLGHEHEKALTFEYQRLFRMRPVKSNIFSVHSPASHASKRRRAYCSDSTLRGKSIMARIFKTHALGVIGY